jgi:excisionase family DNA binding protein
MLKKAQPGKKASVSNGDTANKSSVNNTPTKKGASKILSGIDGNTTIYVDDAAAIIIKNPPVQQRFNENIPLYSVDETAAILKVTRRTVYTYLKSEELKAVKLGKEWRIKYEDLLSFIKKLEYDVPRKKNGKD